MASLPGFAEIPPWQPPKAEAMVEALARDADALVDAAAGGRAQLGGDGGRAEPLRLVSAISSADALRMSCTLLDSPLPPELARHYIALAGRRRQDRERRARIGSLTLHGRHQTEPVSKEPIEDRAEREIETTARAETPAEEPPRLHLHMPVDVRSLSLIVLTVIACIFACNGRRRSLVPILLGVMFSYALTPAVDRLQRWRLPRAVGATIVISAVVTVIGWGVWALADEASALIETLPQVAQKVRQGLEGQARKSDELADRQGAAGRRRARAGGAARVRRHRPGVGSGIGRAATLPARAPAERECRPGAAAGPAQQRPCRARSPASSSRSPPSTSATTSGRARSALFVLVGQFAIVLFVTLFLLASGDTFRRKMVKLAGPRLSQKKITVQALDEVTAQIQRYLLVQLATRASSSGSRPALPSMRSACTTRRSGASSAGITNLVPYIGAVVVGIGSGGGRLRPVRSIDRGALHRRRLVRHPHARRQPADAVVDGPGQPDERVRGLHRRARCSAGSGARGACCSGCRS